jgi:hypothetical protein
MATIAERVVAPDGDQVIHAQELQVLHDFGGEIVDLRRVTVPHMLRNFRLADLAGVGARGVQERAARAPGAVDDLLGQELEIGAIVGLLVAGQLQQAGPPAPDADHLVALAHSADGYCAYRRVKPRDVTPTGEDCDGALFCHDGLLVKYPPLYRGSRL